MDGGDFTEAANNMIPNDEEFDDNIEDDEEEEELEDDEFDGFPGASAFGDDAGSRSVIDYGGGPTDLSEQNLSDQNPGKKRPFL